MLMFFFTILMSILLAVAVVALSAALILDSKSRAKPEAIEFAKGESLEQLLDGFWSGSGFKGLGKGWRGKQFDSASQTGMNVFEGERKYKFKQSLAHGLTNKPLQVVRLDYGAWGNPLALRLITDEVVQVAPGKLLGKIQFRLPGETLTLGYFRLAKQE